MVVGLGRLGSFLHHYALDKGSMCFPKKSHRHHILHQLAVLQKSSVRGDRQARRDHSQVRLAALLVHLFRRRHALVQMVQLDVVVDGARQIVCDLAVADLRAGLGGRDVVLERRRDDKHVVAVLAQRLDGGLGRAQGRPLDDEGAVVAQQDVDVGGRPDLGVAHGEGEVGPDEQHHASPHKGAVGGLDAAQDVVELLVQALEHVGGAGVDGTAGLVAAQRLPVVDHGVAAGLLNGEAAPDVDKNQRLVFF